MSRPKPTYWSELNTLLPRHYRTRTRLTDCYVLQVSGQEDGHHHKVTLYCLMLVGNMRRVWAKRFYLPNDLSIGMARILALEILERELKDRVMKRGRPLYNQDELQESVQDLLSELRTDFSGKETAATA